MENIFLLSLFLLRIPNFYFFPFLRNEFLTTHILARSTIVFSFLFVVYKWLVGQKQFLEKREKQIVMFATILFIAQSLSLFSAINVYSFLNRYKDVVVAFMVFFVSYYYRKNIGRVIFIVLMSSFVNVIFQASLVIFKGGYLNFLAKIISERYFNLLTADLTRGRIFIGAYDEAFIPLFLSYLLKEKLGFFKKTFIILINIGIVYFAIASNFKTNLLMLIFSCGSYIFVFKKQKLLPVFLIFFIVTGLAGALISVNNFGYSIFHRISNEQTIKNSLEPRLRQITEGFMMGEIINGVGLGNYYENLPNSRKKRAAALYEQTIIKESMDAIHNNFAMVFAETGLLGFAAYLFMLILFLQSDILLFRKEGEHYKKSLAISFWTIFVYGLFNPSVSIGYQAYFWATRGLLFR